MVKNFTTYVINTKVPIPVLRSSHKSLYQDFRALEEAPKQVHHDQLRGVELNLILQNVEPSFSNNQYKLQEELDSQLDELLIDETYSTIIIDLRCRRNKMTEKCITGIAGLIGSVPISSHTKEQLVVMNYALDEELTILKKAIKEAVTFYYGCIQFVVKVTKLTRR